MYSPLISWSRYVYLAAIVLALVFVVPVAWFPFQLGKLSVFTALFLVGIVLFVLGRGGRELLRAHGFGLALFVLLLPLAYGVSTYFSTDRMFSIIGATIGVDTLLFTILAALAFIFSFGLFRTLRSVRLLLTVVGWTIIAAIIFQWVSIVFGQSVLPFDYFADKSANLIGKWNDLGILAGFLTVVLLVRAELSNLSLLHRSLVAGVLVMLALFLGIINFTLVWGLLLASSSALVVVVFFLQKKSATRDTSMVKRVPWFGGAGAVVSVLFLIFGSTFNVGLTNLFPVNALEVRPAYGSTLNVINEARGESLLPIFIGSGPNTFGHSWLMHKPLEVNQSIFWNLDFNVGFSTIITALGTVGILGVFAWIIPLLLIIVGLVRVARLGTLSREEKISTVMLGLGSLFLITAMFLYVPNQNVILLTFVLTGATFAFLWRQGRSASAEEVPSRAHTLAVGLISILLITTALISAAVVERRFLVQAYTGSATSALQSGNPDKALQTLSIAQQIEKTPEVLQLITDAANARIQLLAEETETPAAELQEQFTSLASQAVTAGQEAVLLNERDYRSYLVLARLYDFLSTLGVEGAYESAKQSYENARMYNPYSPAIPLALARLEGAQGNITASEEELTKSLTLKSNYTDAILFAVQLSVAKNDIPAAINAAVAAVQTAPGVAPIWFQLGLLYYVVEDVENATLALEQALALVPDYANAKYFLGLSYYAQGRVTEAIEHFQDLSVTNPDNQEVSLILSNMAAGRQPFEDATVPFTPPEERQNAPVEE